MKILPLSDIHGKHEEIFNWILDNIDSDDYDLVTVSGDIFEGTSTAHVIEWENFQKIVDTPIVMCAGNHDYWTTTAFDDSKYIHLLHNEGIEINGVKFWGSPFTQTFCNWAYMKSDEDLFEMWDALMPKNLDVLLSHGPPKNYCDNCNQSVYENNADSHLGSKALYSIIMDKSPKYCFVGHIHTGDRHKIMPNGTNVYNVSVLDEAYKFLNFNPPPTVVALDLN